MTEANTRMFGLRLREFLAFYILLTQDVKEATSALQISGNGYNRRSYVWAVVSVIEGTTYALKKFCLDIGLVHQFTPGELAILTEETYSVNSNGEVFGQPKYVPIDANFLFAIKIFMRLAEEELWQMDLGTAGWSDFKAGIEICNRITHPKTPECLNVSDDDVNVVRNGYCWHWNTIQAAVQKACGIPDAAIQAAVRKACGIPDAAFGLPDAQ